MANLFNGVVKLSEKQYEILKTNGSITVGNKTIYFDENTLYVTDYHIDGEINIESENPVSNKAIAKALEGKIDREEAITNVVTLDTNQNITGDKNFVGKITKDGKEIALKEEIPAISDSLDEDYKNNALSVNQGIILNEKINSLMKNVGGGVNAFSLNSLIDLGNIFGININGAEDEILVPKNTINYKGEEYTLKTGDIFLIVDINVPDYWFSLDDMKLFRMETSKIDLTNYVTNDKFDSLQEKVNKKAEQSSLEETNRNVASNLQEINSLKENQKTKLSELEQDSQHRVVSDSQITSWNEKLDSSALEGYATEEFVNKNGGKIDKIFLNEVEQEIIDKEVHLKVEVPEQEKITDYYKIANKLSEKDLNTIVVPGNYGVANDCANLPVTANGTLFVGLYNNNEYAQQIFVSSNNDIYVRSSTSIDNSIWNEWKKLAQSDELDNIKDIAIASSNTKYAVSNSPDEISNINQFSQKPSNLGVRMRGCAYGNGIYAIVGTSGSLQISTNKAETWETITPFTNDVIVSIAYGGGVFICADSSGKIFKSKNCINWERLESSINDIINSVIYTNGKFVLVGSNGLIAFSNDGQKFDVIPLDITSELTSVIRGLDKYVAVSTSGDILVSINGVDWENKSVDTTHYRTATFGKNMFVIGGQGGKIKYSTDAIYWEDAVSDSTSTVGYIRDIKYVNGKFYAVMYLSSGEGEIWTSLDGASWTKTQKTAGRLWCLSYGDDVLFASGDNGNIWVLNLAINWFDAQPTITGQQYIWSKNMYYLTDGSILEGEIEVHTELTNLENKKVGKVEGKELSTNDFTDEYKNKLDGLNNYDDTNINNRINEIEESIPSVGEFITKDVNNLTNYTLSTGVGSKINLSIDTSTYIMTLSLANSSGTILDTKTIDLPLETMVVNASYNNTSKEVVLTLKNGTTTSFSVADLISGLVPDTRKINGKSLTEDVQISADDIGALTSEDKPNINGTNNYNSSDNFYVPTFKGNYGQILMSNGTNSPSWTNMPDIQGSVTLKGKLPDEYQEVEYIECDGNQYIDTGFAPSGSMTIELKSFAPYPTNTGNDLPLIATLDTKYAVGYVVARYIAKWQWTGRYATGSDGTQKPDKSYQLCDIGDIIHDNAIDLQIGTGESSFLKVTVLGQTYEKTYTDTVHNEYGKNLHLFYDGFTYFIGHVGEIKMKQEGDVVRDLIPCYRKEDNVAGMFDIINGTFYQNLGSGVFIVGNDIEDSTVKQYSFMSEKIYQGKVLLDDIYVKQSRKINGKPLQTDFNIEMKDLPNYSWVTDGANKFWQNEYSKSSNLINLSGEIETLTYRGITITKNSDGTFLINGTVTSASTFANIQLFPTLKEITNKAQQNTTSIFDFSNCYSSTSCISVTLLSGSSSIYNSMSMGLTYNLNGATSSNKVFNLVTDKGYSSLALNTASTTGFINYIGLTLDANVVFDNALFGIKIEPGNEYSGYSQYYGNIARFKDLENKLETKNLIAGENIAIDTNGKDITINSTASGGQTIYDLVIRTQEEFDAWCTTLDNGTCEASSVLLVGDGGYTPFVRENGQGLKLPNGLYTLHGINSPIIMIYNFVYNPTTNLAGIYRDNLAGLGYSESIENITMILMPGEHVKYKEVYHFKNLTGIRNCNIATGNFYEEQLSGIRMTGFVSCHNIENCVVLLISNGYGTTAFLNCENISNCATLIGDVNGGYATCYSSCNRIINAKDISVDSGFSEPELYASNCKNIGATREDIQSAIDDAIGRSY